MKRITSLAIVLALSAVTAAAQTINRITPLTATNCKAIYNGTVYTVQHGDVLYQKYGPKWNMLLSTNPGLQARVSGKCKDTIAWLYDSRGDVLCVPAGMAVNEFITNEAATPPPPETHVVKAAEEKKPESTTATASASRYDNYLWFSLLLLLGAVTFIALWFLRDYIARRHDAAMAREREENAREHWGRELEQNPVTSGPPIVVGGITPTETERLTNHFQDQAVAQDIRATPGAEAATVRQNIRRIGPVEEGMISGEGMVGYADRARPRRINPPQPGYRARFHFPDGSEPELMSLQGCMNPVFYGGGLSGFTFTARAVAGPAPEPGQTAPH